MHFVPKTSKKKRKGGGGGVNAKEEEEEEMRDDVTSGVPSSDLRNMDFWLDYQRWVSVHL